PGHLGSQSGFLEKYKNKKLSVQEDEYLKELVNKVMIRNRRGDTGIEWPERHVETIPIEFSPEERELYDAIEVLRDPQSEFAAHGFSLITLKREACSSREAVFYTLKNMFQKHENPSEDYLSKLQYLQSKIGAITQNSKAEKTLELIQTINDKVIIFT